MGRNGNESGEGTVVVAIKSKGCSRLFLDNPFSLSSLSASFRGLQHQFLEPMSPAAPSSSPLLPSQLPPAPQPNGPFSGLVICVTGLSKEARKQVMDATERLGGQYSPHLHPKCTHLVVQSFSGRKFEHALRHGSRNGFFVVTLGWFVDSVRRNVRLSESLYSVKNVEESGRLSYSNRLVQSIDKENSCLPVGVFEHVKQADMLEAYQVCHPYKDSRRNWGVCLSDYSFYVDADVSAELRSKVVEATVGEGATLVDQWFVGCNASHVVCEGPSIRKYLGHSENIVTPAWVLKTGKEKHLQRLVHVSTDLARQLGVMLENIPNVAYEQECNGNISRDAPTPQIKAIYEDRQRIASLAKNGVRKRRSRRMQMCQTPIRPITPSSLLDSICWSISEPTSTASIYTDSNSVGVASEAHTSVFFDAKGNGNESEASFVNLSRPLTESEKNELVFTSHFLTILFPVDRFAELGPSSRTLFSDAGFTCLQVLDHIYAFYQENMSLQEIEVAIHTDSRHADWLRSLYSSKETAEHGYVEYRRINFLGSRRSFEMLKRVVGDNSNNVYELLIRA